MVRETLDTNRSYKEHIFNNVTSHEQIDPPLVKGILLCVPESGMRTTDEDTLHHIQGDVVHVYTNSKTKEVFAFSSTLFGTPNNIFKSSEISDESGCYLAGSTISKERQSEGFYKIMNGKRIDLVLSRNLNLVFTRTQNPRVQSGIQAVLDEIQKKGLIQRYDLKRILIPGCYGHMLTEEKPVDDKILFDELDYDKGDAYVLLFQLRRNG